MISSLVAFGGLVLFWTLLLSVVGFAGLTAWCLLVELTEAAYRRRARKTDVPPLPFGQAVLREGRRR